MGNANNTTQNQNVFQPTARDLLGIISVNIKLSNTSIQKVYRRKNRTLQFKVFVNYYN